MADVRIKDLEAFSGTPTATDFLAIDSANETKKISGNTFLNNKDAIILPNNIFIKSRYDRDTDPSSPVNGYSLLFTDKDDERVGYIRVDRLDDGRDRLTLGVNNEKTNGDEVSALFQMYVARDGTIAYAISSPEKFRSAIGISYQDKDYEGTLTVPSSSYLEIDDGADFVGKRIVSVMINHWVSNSGAFSVAKGANNEIYLIGNSGTTVRDLTLRFLFAT